MIIVTTDTIANQNIVEVKGLVTSSIVQSRNIGKDILSGLKSVIGGELKNSEFVQINWQDGNNLLTSYSLQSVHECQSRRLNTA